MGGLTGARWLATLRSELRARPVATVTIAASFVLHVGAFVIVMGFGQSPRLIAAEIAAMLTASVVLEVIAFTAPGIGRFRVFHALRFLVVIATAMTLRSHSAVVDLALLLPHLVETALYERESVAIGITAVSITVLVLLRAVTPVVEAYAIDGIAYVVAIATTIPDGRLLVAIEILIGAIFTAAFAIYALHYRERTADMGQQIETLDTTVSNLAEANKAIQIYADTMETRTVARERGTVTRELHDTVGYALTNVIVMMNAASVLAKSDIDRLPDLFDRVRDQTEVALGETRTILYRLRESVRSEISGLAAIRHLINSFHDATGITLKLHQGNVPDSFGAKIDDILFRVVQEGLTNAIRHGKATEVSIQFWLTDSELRLALEDNGVGVGSNDAVTEGIGLAGMRERLSEFSGTVRAEGSERGFGLHVQIPYSRGS